MMGRLIDGTREIAERGTLARTRRGSRRPLARRISLTLAVVSKSPTVKAVVSAATFAGLPRINVPPVT